MVGISSIKIILLLYYYDLLNAIDFEWLNYNVVLILISLIFVKYSSPVGINVGLLWKNNLRKG